MSNENSKELVLVTSDKEVIKVKQDVITKQSQVIKSWVVAEDDFDHSKPLPLPNVDSQTLKMILQWCEKHHHHVDDESNSNEVDLQDDGDGSDDLKDWDAKFVDVDQAVLYQLIMAANYLDMAALLDLLTDRIASMIKGKTVEEIRAYFHIKNDFTPQEEQELRAQNAVAFD